MVQGKNRADKMNQLLCKFCGPNEPIFKQNGPHTQANCSLCGAFIKFVPQGNDIEFMPFGKYKGQKIETIMDKSYLRWLIENLKSGQCNFKNPEKLIKALEGRLS